MIIPDAGIGAIVAALITAGLTFLGLVVTKEQKVSEFRQAWIDSVREDIALLIASVHAVDTHEQLEGEDQHAGWVAARSDFMAANGAMLRLKLRLNPDEDGPAAIIAIIDQMEALINGSLTTERGEQLLAMERELVPIAALMLKGEWRRVKGGEPVFVAVKWTALILLIITGTTLFMRLV